MRSILSRRQLLRDSALAIASGGTILLHRLGAQSRDPFPIALAQGVQAGEVTRGSAILQARLTSTKAITDPRWSGIPGQEGIARFELSTDADFRSPISTDWLESKPSQDYIVKARVGELAQGQRYFYRVRFGADTRDTQVYPAGSFLTHSPDSDKPVSIAVISCMNYSTFHAVRNQPTTPDGRPVNKDDGYPALKTIRSKAPDYLVGLGDTVYYDEPPLGRAETVQQMRMKFQEQFSQPNVVELMRSLSAYWMKDDHDYRFNDSDPVNPCCGGFNAMADPLISSSIFQPSPELGVHVFREQLPLVEKGRSYRTHRINRHLQIWLLEGREYRSPNNSPDGPEKSIWGREQKQWLKDSLAASNATFKILFSSTPMIGPDYAGKSDSHASAKGFRHEADEFFAWLCDRELVDGKLLVICGDRHWQYHAVHPSGVEEFSVGTVDRSDASIGYRPGDPDSTDPDGRIRHPYHNPQPTGGFVLLRSEMARLEITFFNEYGHLLYRVERAASALLR